MKFSSFFSFSFSFEHAWLVGKGRNSAGPEIHAFHISSFPLFCFEGNSSLSHYTKILKGIATSEKCNGGWKGVY